MREPIVTLKERTEESLYARGLSGTKGKEPYGRTKARGHLLLIIAPPNSNVRDLQTTLLSSLRLCTKSPLQRAFITAKELRTANGR
jgi:hypothetical protein